MTTPHQSSPFPVHCQIETLNDTLHLTGTFHIPYNMTSSVGELDAIIALAHADQQAARLTQDVAPHLHKHGSRPFTLITPYGRLKFKRQRLLNSHI